APGRERDARIDDVRRPRFAAEYAAGFRHREGQRLDMRGSCVQQCSQLHLPSRIAHRLTHHAGRYDEARSDALSFAAERSHLGVAALECDERPRVEHYRDRTRLAHARAAWLGAPWRASIWSNTSAS